MLWAQCLVVFWIGAMWIKWHSLWWNAKTEGEAKHYGLRSQWELAVRWCVKIILFTLAGMFDKIIGWP